MIFLFTVAVTWGSEISCSLGHEINYGGTKSPCLVSGQSSDRDGTRYTLACSAKVPGQVEFVSGGKDAQLIDPVSRQVIGRCSVDVSALNSLIREYTAHARAVDNPKCKLEHRAGQIQFSTPSANGLCSFRMNRSAYASFVGATGKKPFYQCEHDYFLVIPDPNEETQVYKKSDKNWQLECSAHLHTSDNEKADELLPSYRPSEPSFIP